MLQRGAFFANFPLTESGLPVSSAEGAHQRGRLVLGRPFRAQRLFLAYDPGRCPGLSYFAPSGLNGIPGTSVNGSLPAGLLLPLEELQRDTIPAPTGLI
jgi:hypothetical protein